MFLVHTSRSTTVLSILTLNYLCTAFEPQSINPFVWIFVVELFQLSNKCQFWLVLSVEWLLHSQSGRWAQSPISKLIKAKNMSMSLVLNCFLVSCVSSKFLLLLWCLHWRSEGEYSFKFCTACILNKNRNHIRKLACKSNAAQKAVFTNLPHNHNRIIKNMSI